MKVRVISGIYGGRWLDAPDNQRTHPMGERIRNALFNSIAEEAKDARVLDAFAGTGAVGLEALSRGAKDVTLVERDPLAFKILSKNVASLGAQDSAKVVKSSVHSWIKTYAGAPFDIIFADPPYHDLQLSTVSELFGLLKPGGLMVLSHTGRGEGPNLSNEIVVVDNRGYGNATLTYFRRVE
ncbi:MAG: 16S rRNA (guanine(966)-N(2))-methyltransferase RsmD [Candidatus Saccharimonas sp.]